jgi:hypothetical protein
VLATAILPAALVVLFPVLFVGFRAFDELLAVEHARHREEWDADGRPRGVFWRPGRARLPGSLARDKLFVKWIFVTPPWAEGDEHARRPLARYRLCVLVWNAGSLLAIGVYLRLALT